jgi:amidase
MLDITLASIEEIHNAYKEKQITVRQLVLSFLSRIAKIDKCSNGLNSVLEINQDSLFIADELDQRLNEGEELTQLFGIPVLLKDNINTADKLHTSAGSVVLADNYAPYDAHIAGRLRNAGAIILGKANMTEFANYMTREGMPSGFSSRGGQVINPYNRSQTPSGSSSGSAVATAAGLCTVAIGTETSGSILSPAERNGIVGIKPTLGLVGRSGIVPISGTHDTAGPMARTVRDAAVLLSVIAGRDSKDAATHAYPFDAPVDYTRYLSKDGLKGARIGINRSQKLEDFTLSEEEKAAFDHLCKSLADAGAILVDNTNIDSNFAIGKIMRQEFKACMNYYLSTLQGSSKMNTLKDIILYNEINSSVALKYGQSILVDAENNTSGTMMEPEYIEALEERERTIAELDRLFNENDIDIMLCETFTNIAPFTGFPSMTIPIGQKNNKIPLGSYWIARRFDEATLFKVTYAAEQLLGIHLAPELDSDK